MSQKWKSVLLMLISVLGFSLVQALVKFMGPSVSSYTKAFYRSFIGLLILLVWMAFNKRSIRFHNLKLLFLRGLFGALSLICLFWTVELIDLSHATLYLYTFPIFAPVFSSLFYKERFHWDMVLPLGLAFFGVYLIAGPGDHQFGINDIIGLGAGVFAGVAISTLRQVRKTDNSVMIYLFFTALSSIVTSAAIMIHPQQYWKTPLEPVFSIPVTWLLVILLGLSATVAQLAMTKAYKHLSTSTGTILSLLTMPIVTLIAVLYFKEPFTWPMLMGGGLIFGAAAYVTLQLNKGKENIRATDFTD